MFDITNKVKKKFNVLTGKGRELRPWYSCFLVSLKVNGLLGKPRRMSIFIIVLGYK
jgi:hypothetical protein